MNFGLVEMHSALDHALLSSELYTIKMGVSGPSLLTVY